MMMNIADLFPVALPSLTAKVTLNVLIMQTVLLSNSTPTCKPNSTSVGWSRKKKKEGRKKEGITHT